MASSLSTALFSTAFLSLTADAHQLILEPEPIWKTNINDRDTRWRPLAFLEGQGYPCQADFNGWRAQNGYKNLRDFMDRAKYTTSVTPGANHTCGLTELNGPPRPIPKDVYKECVPLTAGDRGDGHNGDNGGNGGYGDVPGQRQNNHRQQLGM
ncbi:hypothetical protein GQ600_12296 [Phytophthora cactorum]|nr:hypothetical protein GQ600_12296 [Phytophthora cactorum]